MDYTTCLPMPQEAVRPSCNMEKMCCYQHWWSLSV